MEKTEEPVNRVVHERSRLILLGDLAFHGRKANFTELRDRLGLTGGNLSVHLGVLEEAGYIKIKKKFVKKKPHTEVVITDRGIEALDSYLSDMENLIRSLKKTGK